MTKFLCRVIFLFVYSYFFIAHAWACPEECKCSDGDHRVDCGSAQLTRFPQGLPRDVKLLALNNNAIQKISIEDLKFLFKLETLILTGNKIRHIDENFLDALPSLRRLYLGRNALQNLPQIANSNVGLAVLDMHGNQIKHVEADAFKNLQELKILNLAGNQLQTIPSGVWAENSLVKTIHVGNNPWNCDCRLRSMITYLKLNNVEGQKPAKCMYPNHLRGTLLKNVKFEDLKCFSATISYTKAGFLLNCDNLDLARSIQWLYGSVPIDKSDVLEYEQLDNGSLIVRSEGFSVEDFVCAVNYLISPSRQTRQLIRSSPNSDAQSRPQFTYTPKDRSYREGSAVKLNCEVIGSPRPYIRWFFNDRMIEPSRKFNFTHENTQLVIYPFLDQDVGSYTCEASNQYGRIQAKASIQIIRSSPPVIIEGPHSAEAQPGQQITFRCKARGEPKPGITWFFDGSEIPDLNGHFRASDDGTELTITHVTRQDQGTYSCMAGNSVGSMTTDAALTVKSSQLDYLDRSINDQVLKNIVNQASQNVDRAIQNTQNDLKRGITSPEDLLRHFKFAAKKPTELSRAREIYEESLRLIAKHVELGLRLKPDELPTNMSFESVLAVSHIQTIMELSGCMNGQFKDPCADMCFHSKYRSYTGQCNNFDHPRWGVSQMPFHRLLPPIYENGFNTPIGWDPNKLYYGYRKPNPRTVSMELIGTEDITPHHRFSSMLMQWGQFIDHDLDFTATALSRQTFATGAICNKTCENIDPCFNIPLPHDDPRRKQAHKVKYPCIEFERSAAICGSGETSPIFRQVTYREQVNIITSYIDGSMIYGSTEVDAIDLRDLFGDHGQLRFDIVSASQKPYMPFEKDSSMDCRRNTSVDNPIRCFLSGDFRANEQLGLTSMHTLWFREHNRIATKLLEMNPDWDGEKIYHETRKIIGGMLQHITYKHWLPKVMGKDGYNMLIGDYMGYRPEVKPDIANAFATAAFRFGHTLINPKLERLNENFESIAVGPLPLHEAFFAPERLLAEGGIDPILRGLFASPLKKPMSHQLLNKELTEKLFNRAHDVSLDLAVMNIQRGRDHGIPGYSEFRRFCNLSVPNTWEDLAIDIPGSGVLEKLKKLYGHPGNVDLWVGGVVERRLPDSLIGPTFSCIIGDQFKRLRDGDRFWYENPGVFTPLQLQQIKKSSLAKVLCNNGDNISRVQDDVFLYVGENTKLYKKCEEIPEMNLKMWMSCCDNTCSGGGGGERANSDANRRRRSHHLYQAPHNHCMVEGLPKHDGEKWNSDDCTVCECKDAEVWCKVDKMCKANSPTNF